MKLHLFNPENDLALAAGTANFTPPKSVVEFRTALAALPAWIADEGDNIYAPNVNRSWLQASGLHVGLRCEGIPAPWGWSANAVEQFKKLGINGAFPDTDKHRRLSHRRSAIELHRALRDRLPYPLPPEPVEITSVNSLPQTDCIVLKSPWSCSGRGVVDCESMSSNNIKRRAADSIRKQGSVIVEPKLRKERDFAMLFHKRKFCGLSLFITSGTAYAGNIVAPQSELESMLDVPYLHETASAIEQCLPSGYDGPLGVDMMIYENDSDNRLICPTVEINFRLTMGFVALALHKRFGRGEFRIARGPQKGLQLVPEGGIFSAALQVG